MVIVECDCSLDNRYYDQDLHATFCLTCGLQHEATPSWALTEQDIYTLEGSREFDEDSETYLLTISPNWLGWQRYYEQVNFIENKLGMK